ncbi:MAG: hypothetical protein PVG22_04320 [Chromatiales bacterium]|jgi:hypothetical protein
MSNYATQSTRPLVSSLSLVLFAGTVLFGAQTALAQDAGQETVIDSCMQDIYGKKLTCAANDIQLSAVDPETIEITDPCLYPGDYVTFKATFETVLTADARHDIGIYFDVGADPEGDGALTGTCAVSTLHYREDPPWLDLDGTSDMFVATNIPSGIQDTCGDIDADHNPLYPVITITAQCVDNDGDGYLDLPYCTSWRQPGANELCTGPLAEYDIGGPGLDSSGVIPGSPSKCNCNPGFNVPVPVPAAELAVNKTASPTSVDEPSGAVTYTVSVSNNGVDPNNSVTLNTLDDDIYGDITKVQGDILTTTCSVPQAIDAGSTYTCTFNATVSGNASDTVTDTVTASGVDDNGNSLTGSDDAEVTINDLLPSIAVVKTANPIEVLEPGGQVSFSVLVTNNSVSSDPVTITSLSDSVHGNLNGQGTCSVPQTLAGNGGTYSCSFTANVTGNAGYVETDMVTASGSDDEGNSVSASDSATVTVLNVESSITLVKTANPTLVDEPGGDVTYTFEITNTSSVDTVIIQDGVVEYEGPYLGLYDSILGDLNGQGTCTVPQTLAPGGSYSCTLTVTVEGNAFDVIANTATAKGYDDDGEPVMAADDASVNIENVPPAASLTKTPTSVLVTYTVEVCNLSEAESLSVDVLEDDVYGDITYVHDAITQTNCAVSQTLAPFDQAGSCYTCSFDAATTTSPTTDTVTGTVSDDEGSFVNPEGSATVTFGTVTP